MNLLLINDLPATHTIESNNEASMEDRLGPTERQCADRMPIRVCYLIDSLTRGGTELFLLSLIANIDRDKVTPYLCLLKGGDKDSQSLEPRDCIVSRLGIEKLLTVSTAVKAWEFYRFLRRNRIDVLHTIFADSTYFGVPVGCCAGVKTIRTRRNTGYWLTPFRTYLQRIMGYIATTTVANCEAARQSIVSQDARAVVEIIPNGIDVERFVGIRAPRREPRTVGIMANLRPVKNIGLLIEAAALLAKSHPDVVYHIGGEGELRAELEALAVKRGIADRVKFLGQVVDVESFLADVDVAVLCSNCEGLSNAILEYMCAGRPVIATAVGGTTELIRDGETGILVPPGDSQTLASAIHRVLSCPELAGRLGAAARETVCEKYSRSLEARRYEELYQRLVRPAKGGR